MSDLDGSSYSSVAMGSTGYWLACTHEFPQEVASELLSLTPSHLNTNGQRGLGELASEISAIMISGVIGNAAWAAIPFTATFIRAKLGKRSEPVDFEGASNVVNSAARSAYGSTAAIEIRRAVQLPDETWDIEIAVNGQPGFARVLGNGGLVFWSL